MKRFEVIQNIPSPYRIHLFGEMYRQLRDRGVEFHVNFMSDMSRGHDERPISWRNPRIDFPHTFWRDYGIKNYHLNPGIIWKLRRRRPEYLLVGSTFDTFTSLAVTWLCPAYKRCAWTEGNTKTTGVMYGLKGWLKRAVFSKYEFVAVPGSDASKYIRMHQDLTRKKMPETLPLPNLIDERRFLCRSCWNKADIISLRQHLKAGSETKVCIIPARLSPVKGLMEFINLLTSEIIVGWQIIILGQGELRHDIDALITKKQLGSQIQILDFVPYSEMPMYYAASDLFLLPSRYDPNPLSVVEALHSGLPVALSSMLGNVEEAVVAGKNGWVLPVNNQQDYAKTLRKVFSTTMETLKTFGAYSKEYVADYWNTRRAVSSFLNAILMA